MTLRNGNSFKSCYFYKKKALYDHSSIGWHSVLRQDATQKKRCEGFDFKFKKFRIKQAIFINDIFPSRVKAHTQKKI